MKNLKKLNKEQVEDLAYRIQQAQEDVKRFGEKKALENFEKSSAEFILKIIKNEKPI